MQVLRGPDRAAHHHVAFPHHHVAFQRPPAAAAFPKFGGIELVHEFRHPQCLDGHGCLQFGQLLSMSGLEGPDPRTRERKRRKKKKRLPLPLPSRCQPQHPPRQHRLARPSTIPVHDNDAPPRPQCTRRPMPTKGRLSVLVPPSNPSNICAIVNAKAGRVQNNRLRGRRPLLRCKPGRVREPIHLSQTSALDPPRIVLFASLHGRGTGSLGRAQHPRPPCSALQPPPNILVAMTRAGPCQPSPLSRAFYGLDRCGVGGVPKCEDPSCSTCTLPRRPSPSSLPLLLLIHTHH